MRVGSCDQSTARAFPSGRRCVRICTCRRRCRCVRRFVAIANLPCQLQYRQHHHRAGRGDRGRQTHASGMSGCTLYSCAIPTLVRFTLSCTGGSHTLPCESCALPAPVITMQMPRHAMVTSVAVSPDNKHVVSGSDDKTVCIWDISTGRMLHTLKVGHRSVTHRQWR